MSAPTPLESVQEPPSLSEAATDVIDSVQGLVEDHVALSLARSTRQVQTFVGPVLLGVGAAGAASLGAVFALIGITLVLATQVPLWAATGIVGGGLVLFATLLAAVSVWLLRRAVERSRALRLDDA